MRIAHVTDYYLPRLGGVEMHVRDLATRQQAAGHDVEVITSFRRPRDERVREDDSLRVHRLTETLPLPTGWHPWSIRAVRKVLREGGYDVMHVHAGPVTPLAYAAADLAAEIPTVITMHSMISYVEPIMRALDVPTRWTRWPAVYTAVSDVAAQPLRRLVAPAPVHVLTNGIDAANWHIEPEPREPGEVLVVAVMRLAPRKRPLHLLRMLRRAKARLGDDIKLRAVIVGDGPKRESVERHLARYDMENWVSLPGRLPRHQIRALFAKADMFVAPATLESFGIAALEARCAGLPVVARAEGGIVEFVTDGQEGLLASSDDEMVDAIVRLATDQKEREAIARRNRTIQPTVNWPEVLDRTYSMYHLARELSPAVPARGRRFGGWPLKAAPEAPGAVTDSVG
jgi:glycosyltransferase involved in cell wall biosynthesis